MKYLLINVKNILTFAYIIISLIIGGLFVSAAISWPGSPWSYMIFSAAFFGMLVMGVIKRVSFGYIFLTVTLWIGFWLKLTIHTIDGTRSWAEPTGFFDFSPDSWDQIALLSSIGAVAVLCAGIFWKGTVVSKWRPTSLVVSQSVRVAAWTGSLVIVAVTVFVNEYFNISHAGIASPVLDVPWPIQGFFNWFIGATLVMLLIPLYLEVASGKPWLIPVMIVLIAGAVVAISIGSRGTLAFQSAWIILVAVTYRSKVQWLNWSRIVQIVVLCTAMVAIVGVVAQMRREAWWHGATQPASHPSIHPASHPSIQPAIQPVAAKFVFSPRTLLNVARLPVDRWVGLEGLMAVFAYPGKDPNLLLRAMSEKRIEGKADMFTAVISNSGTTDTTKLAYATLPGMFAYWYYSNNSQLMFGIVFLLVTLVIAIERTVSRVTCNPFFAVSIGLTSAIAVNMSPGSLLIPAAMLALNIGLVVVLGMSLRLFIESKSVVQ